MVGRVYASQKAERSFEYKKGTDCETDKDFEGIDIRSMICVRMRNGRTYDVTINRHPVPATELVW